MHALKFLYMYLDETNHEQFTDPTPLLMDEFFASGIGYLATYSVVAHAWEGKIHEFDVNHCSNLVQWLKWICLLFNLKPNLYAVSTPSFSSVPAELLKTLGW